MIDKTYQTDNKIKFEDDVQNLGQHSTKGFQEQHEGERTSVDLSERIEDENQYDHTGDDKFKVDNTPEFTSKNEYDCPIDQRTGFTKDYGPGKDMRDNQY